MVNYQLSVRSVGESLPDERRRDLVCTKKLKTNTFLKNVIKEVKRNLFREFWFLLSSILMLFFYVSGGSGVYLLACFNQKFRGLSFLLLFIRFSA